MQRFVKGDRVRIGEMPPMMFHFPGTGLVATVEYSYADKYPEFDPTKDNIYSLKIPGHGSVSWYPGEILTAEDYD